MKQRTPACTLSSILIHAQRGNATAREQLAELLLTELAPIVARAARAAPGAERDDVTQDTFLRLIEPRTPYDPARGTAHAYCFQAARSAANYRGHVREQERMAADDPEAVEDRTGAPRVEVCNELRAARAVDHVMFEIVTSIELEGVTAKEAGRRFGMTPSKVCRALHDYACRCKAALRAAA